MSSFSCTHNPQNEPPKPGVSDKASVLNTDTSKVSSTKVNTAKVHNRIRALMEHTTRYAFKGEARLASDSGVSKSALNRLLNGHSSPSFALVSLLTAALERQLNKGSDLKRLDPRDLVSLDGTYPTLSVCDLAGCRGCLPTSAYDENEQIKPEYKDIRPGQWSLPQPQGIPQPGLRQQPQAQVQPLPTPAQEVPRPQKLPPLLVPVEIFASSEEEADDTSEDSVQETP